MPMIRIRTLAIAYGLALMALIPTTAFAASTAYESISGVEIGIPIPCGSGESQSSFAGTARGTINGVWSASVCHTGLSTHGVAATISGGSFQLSGLIGWKYVRASGSISGSIGPGVESDHTVNGVGTCTQVFVLGIVGNATFPAATLVHYGAFFAGSCHVLSATLSGTGQVTY
jgi:hypothetical protein